MIHFFETENWVVVMVVVGGVHCLVVGLRILIPKTRGIRNRSSQICCHYPVKEIRAPLFTRQLWAAGCEGPPVTLSVLRSFIYNR